MPAACTAGLRRQKTLQSEDPPFAIASLAILRYSNNRPEACSMCGCAHLACGGEEVWRQPIDGHHVVAAPVAAGLDRGVGDVPRAVVVDEQGVAVDCRKHIFNFLILFLPKVQTKVFGQTGWALGGGG